jgi:hypothetical protein
MSVQVEFDDEPGNKGIHQAWLLISSIVKFIKEGDLIKMPLKPNRQLLFWIKVAYHARTLFP